VAAAVAAQLQPSAAAAAAAAAAVTLPDAAASLYTVHAAGAADPAETKPQLN
jgi:hypothetical protein